MTPNPEPVARADLVERLEELDEIAIKRLLRAAIYRSAKIDPLPEDAEKSDKDWITEENLAGWRQMAFQEHCSAAIAYLNGTMAGEQTGRDIHMVCQGMQIAREAALDVLRNNLPVILAALRERDALVAQLATYKAMAGEMAETLRAISGIFPGWTSERIKRVRTTARVALSHYQAMKDRADG